MDISKDDHKKILTSLLKKIIGSEESTIQTLQELEARDINISISEKLDRAEETLEEIYANITIDINTKTLKLSHRVLKNLSQLEIIEKVHCINYLSSRIQFEVIEHLNTEMHKVTVR